MQTESINALMELAASMKARKTTKLAPGGLGAPSPAPKKIRGQNGVSESEYIMDTLTKIQGAMGPQQPTGSATMPQGQAAMGGEAQDIMGALAGLMGGGQQ